MKKYMIALILSAMCAGLAGCQETKPEFKDGELYINEVKTVSSADIDAEILRYGELSADGKNTVYSEFKENMGMNFTSFVGKIPSEFSLTDFFALALPDPNIEGKTYKLHDYVFEFDSESGKKINLSVSPFGTPSYDIIIESDSKVTCTLNGATVTGYSLNGSIYAFVHHGELDYILDVKGFTEDEFKALILSLTSETEYSDVILSDRGTVSNILSPADSEFFTELISDETRYVQTAPNCLMDCFLTVDGVEMQYHTDCGNLFRLDNGKCLTLTDEEKNQLNEVFAKNMALGIGMPEDTIGDYGVSVSVGKIQLSFMAVVSSEDAEIIDKLLLDSSRYEDGLSDCYSDCVVQVGKKTYLYHSDCGTFSDNINEKSFKLTDAEKEEINGILSKYIFLGFDIEDTDSLAVSDEHIEIQPVVYYAWNISFGVENISPTGLTLICTQNGGFDFGELITGSAYGLEVRDGYGWAEVKPLVDEVFWTEIAYVLTENAETKWNINWENLYGELPAGQYRIYKEVSGPRSPDKTETQKYYAEFEIGSVSVPVVEDEWGIKFEAMDATSTGMTLGYMQYGGDHPDYSYYFEYPYWIEKFENGVWSEVPYASFDFEWVIPEIGSFDINNSSKSSNVNWTKIYGELPAGKYRYCKNVMVYGVVESEYKSGVNLKKTYYAEFEIVDPWGVTLTAKNVTDSGLTIVCEQVGVSGAKELLTGSYYTIEKLVNNGWKTVDYLPHEYEIGWTTEGWLIPENQTVEWLENWEWLYGKLSPGKYRIGKSIMYWLAPGDYEKKMYYAEFEISDPDALVAEEWGVSLSVGDVTPEGLTVYLTQKGDTPGESLNYNGKQLSDMVTGMAYWLETEILGEWQEISYLTSDTVPTWTQALEQVVMNATTNWKLEWQELYGVLPLGKYRIGKTVSAKLPSNEIQRFNIYAEFEITRYTQYTPSELGISAKAENVTSKGLDYVITQSGDPLGFNKYNGRGFSTKSEYSYVLERFDGVSWETVEPLKESYIYEYATPWVPLNTSTTIHIDWSEFYGELPAGKYRISKNFYFGIAAFDEANFDVFAEFEIK